MPNFTVERHGTDSSGRPIYMTHFFWKVWNAFLHDERIEPFAHKIVVVQGAFMTKVGGGASASAGYHDKGGCIDIRTWNLSKKEQQTIWDVARLYGINFWKRDKPAYMGGMDEHGHCIAGWDKPLARGAAVQWQQAKNKRDGLARNAPDYMKRNTPLATFPPKNLIKKEYLMTSRAEKMLDTILAEVRGLAGDEKTRYQKTRERDKQRIATLIANQGAMIDVLNELANDLNDKPELKGRVQAFASNLKQDLANDPDVDGADNPAVDA